MYSDCFVPLKGKGKWSGVSSGMHGRLGPTQWPLSNIKLLYILIAPSFFSHYHSIVIYITYKPSLLLLLSISKPWNPREITVLNYRITCLQFSPCWGWSARFQCPTRKTATHSQIYTVQGVLSEGWPEQIPTGVKINTNSIPRTDGGLTAHQLLGTLSRGSFAAHFLTTYPRGNYNWLKPDKSRSSMVFPGLNWGTDHLCGEQKWQGPSPTVSQPAMNKKRYIKPGCSVKSDCTKVPGSHHVPVPSFLIPRLAPKVP